MTPLEPVDSPTPYRKFHLHSCLGRGGFGEVYLADMTSAGGVRSRVAIKLLHAEVDPRSQALQRLNDEARLLGMLNHPCILRVHDLVYLEGRIALVAEYVEGADLDDCVERGKMPLSCVVEVIGYIASALQAAWEAPSLDDGEPLHLVHRDVKPANIRIGRHGDVKLLDFGIAKAANVKRAAKTQTALAIGSQHYMAPERFDPDLPAATPGDIFSLGCVLFDAVCTDRFYGDTDIRGLYLYSIEEERYAKFMAERQGAVRADTPPEVRALIHDLLQWDPEARPTASDLVARCDDLAKTLSGPSLRRWCLEYTWPPPLSLDAPLCGQVVTESSLTAAQEAAPRQDISEAMPPPSTPSEATPMVNSSETMDPFEVAPATRSRSLLLIPVLVGALMFLGFVIVSGLGIGSLAPRFLETLVGEEDASVTENKAPDAPTAAPSSSKARKPLQDTSTPKPVKTTDAAKPTRAEAPATAAPAPKASSRPTPKASPPAPKKTASSTPVSPPEPVPEAPVAPTTGQVAVSAGVPVVLKRGGQLLSPGDVSPGSVDIYADFGEGSSLSRSFEVTAGQSYTVSCMQLREVCEVK
jgi:serine/threonine protein kinase